MARVRIKLKTDEQIQVDSADVLKGHTISSIEQGLKQTVNSIHYLKISEIEITSKSDLKKLICFLNEMDSRFE